ncbi:hypothetical protein RM190_00580 [Paracoccus sp. CPCC 101403]|uniref:Uncharacterized protein n=1 Tax=Paracoccus broussonetiae TaxID=3075834 RepID=A0ABU3E7Y2_9RHOB|nr:hypothetical protein [Paracoccus sp. CPCC 101403]MDT1060328.1 hypothetical protein [Paracoccus sp. CPCC 101403]
MAAVNKAEASLRDWRKWATEPGPVDRNTVAGLLTLIDDLTRTRIATQVTELSKAIGLLIAEERAATKKALADASGRIAMNNVCRVTMNAHLDSLARLADDLQTKRAALIGGEPSPLLAAALRIGEGKR